MLYSNFISVICLFASVIADAAPVSRDSPEGVVFSALFIRGDIKGTVGFGVISGFVFGYTRLTGFPEDQGPFDYSIHQRRVFRQGLCKGTLGIFDPYDGEPDAPTEAEYMVGDLSGKHGKIEGRSSYQVFFDPYLSLNSENAAYFGDLSMVISDSDTGARLTCVNMRQEPTGTQVPKDILEQAQKLVDEYQKKNGNLVDQISKMNETVAAPH